MKIQFVTNEKIAETSSKGNQEKWFDKTADKWYKLDQFNYEALSEALISELLESSNIEQNTPFTFVRYQLEKAVVHGNERTVCSSRNFLKKGQSVITLSHLFKRSSETPLSSKLNSLNSDRKRIEYLADTVAEYTQLDFFPQYPF